MGGFRLLAGGEADGGYVWGLGRGGNVGLSMYVLGLAFGLMTLAPLSECFGKSPICIISYGVFLFFILGTALVQDVGGFLVLRILSGAFSLVNTGIRPGCIKLERMLKSL